MAVWQFIVGQGAPAVALPTATGRRVDLRLRAPSTASFAIDGRRDEAAEILELATDLFVYRDNVLVFRGVIGSTSDAIDVNSHTVNVEAVDYRGRLSRFILEADATFTEQPDQDIVWSLVTTAQDRLGANLGITRGSVPDTPAVRTETIKAGTTVFDAIETFAQAEPGFDWTITPELILEMWSQRGGLIDDVLTLGGSLAGIARRFNPTDYANAVRGSGETGLAASLQQAPNIATAIEGRWDAQRGWTDVSDASTLTAKTAKALADAQVAPEQYSLTMRQGWWQGVDHVDVGDTARMVVKSGRLDIDRTVRVQDISIAIGDDGQEDVLVTTADVATPYLLRAHEVERRLRVLERR